MAEEGLVEMLQRELAFYFGAYHGSLDHGRDAAGCDENECVRVRALLTTEQVQGAWLPMSSAPQDGSRILVDFGRVGIHAVAWQQGVSGTTGWCVDDLKFGPYPLRRYISEDVKGWMPLPLPAPPVSVTADAKESK